MFSCCQKKRAARADQTHPPRQAPYSSSPLRQLFLILYQNRLWHLRDAIQELDGVHPLTAER
eukprot:3405999-Prymnesium_polylepis.1